MNDSVEIFFVDDVQVVGCENVVYFEDFFCVGVEICYLVECQFL